MGHFFPRLCKSQTANTPVSPHTKLKNFNRIMVHLSNMTCNFFRYNNKDAGLMSWKITMAISLTYIRIDIVSREIF